MRAVLLLLVTGLPAAAQSIDGLVAEALANNREILAAQKRYEAARQRPARESALPDPMISLGYTSNGSPRPIAGLGTNPTSNGGMMVSQELPYPGKLKLRGEIAEREADAEFQDYLAVRLRVVSRLKQAYHTAHHAQESIDIITKNQQLLKRFIQVAESRYSVGRAAQQDVFRAQTQYAILDTQRLRYEQELSSGQAEIVSLLNRPPGGSVQMPASIPLPVLRAGLEELYAHARTAAPALLKEQKIVERGELSVNLARKGYFPDSVVSGGYFNQGSMPPMYQFRVDVRVPLYYWRKQRAEVAEESFRLNEARSSYEAAGQDLNFRIKNDYLVAQTSGRLMDLYMKSVIPEARLALESSIVSYETGSLDFLPLLTNFMTVVDYELMYHEEMMRFYLALDRLEEATGLDLDR